MDLLVQQKNKTKNSLQVKGIIYLCLAISTVLSIFFYYKYKESTLVKLDSETLCPNSGPCSITAVLIDLTDPLSVIQREDLKKRLYDFKEDLAQYGNLQIYPIGTITNSLLKPTINICNPGRGDNLNTVTGNPVLMKKKWREKFSNPLDQILDNLLSKDIPENVSPIMESIQSIVISAFKGKALIDIPKKLIIISDMIQNSPALNQYQGNISFEQFKLSPNFSKVRADLKNVEVDIIYIRRETFTKLQGRAHIIFWEKFIHEMGGINIHVVSLFEGINGNKQAKQN